MKQNSASTHPLCVLCIAAMLAAMAGAVRAEERSRLVTATAYTSRPSEIANKRSKETACKDHLNPRTEAGQTIAISLDLAKAGLECGMVVTIEGLEGEFIVNDHLPEKDRNHVDIYLGKDVSTARKWGKRKVRISWTVEESSGRVLP